MRWRRGRHVQAPQPQQPQSRARRIGRVARWVVPLMAAAAIAIFAVNLPGTLGQFVGGITNTQNHVLSATTTPPPSVQLNENDVCSAPADGTVHECATDLVNKFGAGTLASHSTRTVSVTLENASDVSAQLFLLPSNCSDTLTGARGALCNQVSVQVTCGSQNLVGPPAVTLNQFHDGRNFPTGYAVTPVLAAGAETTCTFTITTGLISQAGTVSQPISIRLTAT